MTAPPRAFATAAAPQGGLAIGIEHRTASAANVVRLAAGWRADHPRARSLLARRLIGVAAHRAKLAWAASAEVPTH